MKQLIAVIMALYTVLLYSYDYLPDNMPLNKALLALSHNGAQSKYYGWRYYQQLGDVRAQWKAGSRGDKINLHWRKEIGIPGQLAQEAEKHKGGKIISKIKKFVGAETKEQKPFIALCHDPDPKSNCLATLVQKSGKPDGAEGYFKEWAMMLKENPKDVIVLILEDYTHYNSKENGTNTYPQEQIRKELDSVLEKSGLAQYAYKLQDRNKFPTIGQMRSSGKRVLIFNDNRYNAAHSPYLNYSYFYSTHWVFDWQEDLKTGACKMKTTGMRDPYFVVDVGPEQSILQESKKGKLLAIPGKLGISSIQGHDITPTDYKIVNSKENIIKRVDQCQLKVPNVLVTAIKIDFIEIGDTYKAVREINENRMKMLNAKN